MIDAIRNSYAEKLPPCQSEPGRVRCAKVLYVWRDDTGAYIQSMPEAKLEDIAAAGSGHWNGASGHPDSKAAPAGSGQAYGNGRESGVDRRRITED